MSAYSCHSDRAGPQPRGRTGRTLVQDGWRLQQGADYITRDPVMRTVRTDWLPMKCGALKQAGKTDPNCVGCVNRTDQ